MVAVFLATWLTQGMAVVPEVSQRTMYATLPLIAVLQGDLFTFRRNNYFAFH
jgi:hypothetical protein